MDTEHEVATEANDLASSYMGPVWRYGDSGNKKNSQQYQYFSSDMFVILWGEAMITITL